MSMSFKYFFSTVDMYLCYIIEVTVSQTAIAPAAKRHDNAPVCKLKIKNRD